MSTGGQDTGRGSDPRLDRYRLGIAVVTHDRTPVGYLATRVQSWSTRRGRWPLHRYADPVERPEWLLTVLPPGAEPAYDDGVVDDVTAEIDDWDNGRFAYRGQTLTLHWLHGPDAETAWTAYGWHDTTP